MKDGIESFSEKSFVLYRCSPLLDFIKPLRSYGFLETQIAKELCSALNLCVDGQKKDLNAPEPTGEIYKLRFRPFTLKDYDYDQGNNESPPLKFELEYQNYRDKKEVDQSMIFLPAKRIPAESTKVNDQFWFYPLVFSKLSAPVFNVISKVFENLYRAHFSSVKLPLDIIEYVVNSYAEFSLEPVPQEHELVGVPKRYDQRSDMLNLHYIPQEQDFKVIKFSMSTNQVVKMCKLHGDPKQFLTAFQNHIRNTTKINIAGFHLVLASSTIVTITSGKIKIHERGSIDYAYRIINRIAEYVSNK